MITAGRVKAAECLSLYKSFLQVVFLFLGDVEWSLTNHLRDFDRQYVCVLHEGKNICEIRCAG